MLRRMGRSAWDRHRGKVGFFLLLTLLIVALAGIDFRVRPVITTMSLYQGKKVATEIINSVVETELSAGDNGGQSYDDLVIISRNEQNEITSLQMNIVQANRLKSRITTEILKGLATVGEREMNIPLGTFLGNEFFSGRGPEIPFKLAPSGYVETQFENYFEAAGINQTLHRVTLSVTTHVTVILPGYTASSDVVTDFMVAQTLINGVVPNTFLPSGKAGITVAG